MKANNKLLLVLLAALALNFETVKAQLFKDVSIGANAGAYVYQGDLSPSNIGSLKTPSFGFNIYAQKALSNYLSFRLNFGAAKLKGDESKYDDPAYRQKRNFMFSSPLKELSVLIVWNIKGDNYNNYGVSPYLFTGITASFLNVNMDYTRIDTTSSLFKDPTIYSKIAADVDHGTPGILPVVPIGLGLEFPISQKLFITTEASYRFTFSDYIDGFSIAAEPDKKDHYYSATIGLRYRLNNSGNDGANGGKNQLGCPTNLVGF
ncbi:MAG: DUF6089 family protein [Bacteroidota bacterium]